MGRLDRRIIEHFAFSDIKKARQLKTNGLLFLIPSKQGSVSNTNQAQCGELIES